MDCHVVEATPADLEPLLVMMADFNALEGLTWSADRARPALAQLLSDQSLGVVLHLAQGSTRLGYAVLTWGFDLEWAGREAYLTELFLRPEARGQGFGRAVLPAVEAIALSHGAQVLHLMMRPENEPAARLYRAAGYRSPPRVFLSKPLVSP
jgi:ribosomal protein S18 acetylase RimI-like enzyme